MFLDVTHPRWIFPSKADVLASSAMLREFRDSGKSGHSNAELWNARLMVEACSRGGVDGEPIPRIARMATFMPLGIPVLLGMLTAPPTLLATAFWQALNQTQNALVNYCNRSATSETSTPQAVGSYVLAVTSSSAVAIGTNALIKASSFSDTMKTTLFRFSPFVAVCSANILNVVAMRSSELQTGIDVVDEDGHVLGQSKLAAQNAIAQTAATRVILPIPVLVFPALAVSAMQARGVFTRFPRLYIPTYIGLCSAAFGLALPLTLALFKPSVEVEPSKLEKEFQSRIRADGSPVRLIRFDKGI